MKPALLSVRGLRVSFPFPAVKGVDLDVGEGEFASLVGESGSGKSVTALALCRLLPPSAKIDGAAHYEGKNLLSLDEAGLLSVRGRRIAYVFQDPSSSLDPVMRVGAQIVEARRAHFRESEREAASKAFEFLCAARVDDAERVFKAYPHELSGGLKQRATIAMALAMEPRLLVADEPTTALDVTTQAGILALLKALQREKGLAILFITHDLSLAARFSDTVTVLEKGKVAERMEKKDGKFVPISAYGRRLFHAELGSETPKTLIGGTADA